MVIRSLFEFGQIFVKDRRRFKCEYDEFKGMGGYENSCSSLSPRNVTKLALVAFLPTRREQLHTPPITWSAAYLPGFLHQLATVTHATSSQPTCTQNPGNPATRSSEVPSPACRAYSRTLRPLALHLQHVSFLHHGTMLSSIINRASLGL